MRFVDSAPGLALALRVLCPDDDGARPDCIGLDAEWKPNMGGQHGGGSGGQSRASLLQVATRAHVFVFVYMLAGVDGYVFVCACLRCVCLCVCISI